MFSGGCQLLVSMTGQISQSNRRFIFWQNQKPSLSQVPEILRWKFLNDHVLFSSFFNIVIFCHDGVSGSHCIAKIQSRGMSKSSKQKIFAGASLLANVRMTARDMPGADPVQRGQPGKGRKHPRWERRTCPTQDAVLAGGFKYFLFSPLFGEGFQFD